VTAEAPGNDLVVQQALLRAQEAVAPSVAGVSTSVVWRFEVVDPAAVPREFLVVDEVAVRAAIRGGRRDIPGLRIYDDTRISVRT
jgi:hypothetical protein